MRIGIDIRTLMDKRYSGVSEYTHNLVRSLLELNREKGRHQFTLWYNSARKVSVSADIVNAGGRIFATKYPNKLFNYFLQKQLYRPKIDRTLAVDLFLMPHINYISLSRDCHSLLTVHDLSFLRYPEFYSFRKNIWHRIMNVRKLTRQFDRIIAVSENTKRDLIELCSIDEKKIRVVYSGVSSEYQPLQPENDLVRIRKKYGLSGRFILYLGNIEPRKNLTSLVRSFEAIIGMPEFGQVELVFAGAVGWKNQEIATALAESPARSKIKTLGYIDSRDKPPLLNMANVLVYPSFYEGFGLPVLEALASGTPVITSNISSMPEVAQGMTTLVNPFNIKDLIMALTTTLKSSLVMPKSITDREKIDSYFNWRLTAEKYMEIINEFY